MNQQITWNQRSKFDDAKTQSYYNLVSKTKGSRQHFDNSPLNKIMDNRTKDKRTNVAMH